MVQQEDPELTSWITAERVPGLRCCFDALDDLDGVETALAASPVPVLLWDGVKDPHHRPSRDLAARLPDVRFLETPGDHAGAFIDYGSEAVRAIRELVLGRSPGAADGG